MDPSSDIAEPTPPPGTPEPADARRQRRAARRERGGWIGGAILIALGLIFLAQNYGFTFLGNWWALFILIPAVGSLGRSYAAYRQGKSLLSRAVRGPLLGGLFLLLLTFVLFFNITWMNLWPLFLIVGGILLLLNGVLPED